MTYNKIKLILTQNKNYTIYFNTFDYKSSSSSSNDKTNFSERFVFLFTLCFSSDEGVLLAGRLKIIRFVKSAGFVLSSKNQIILFCNLLQ